MAEEKLVAKIETKGAKNAAEELERFAKGAEKSERAVDDLGKEVKSNEKNLKSFKDSAANISSALKAVTVTAAATISATAAIAVAASKAEREMANLARVARQGVDDFKATAFATESVGISAEKLSDISKDTNEKLGEFISTGGGGFKDFFEQVAPLVNLTAQELQGLSGPDVLQRVKNAMDSANVSMERQSFYLEGIASDTTLLLPLLDNHGKKIEELKGNYNKFNAEILLTPDATKNINELANEFDLLQKTMGNASSYLVASFAPQLKSVMDWVLQNVPTATKTIATFFQQFLDTKNKTDLDALQVELYTTEKAVERLGKRVDEFNKTGSVRSQTQIGILFDAKASQEEVERTVTNYNLGVLKIEEIKARMDAIKNGGSKTPDIPSVGSLFVSTKKQQERESEAKKELDWWQARLSSAISFNEQISNLNLDQFELIDKQLNDKLKLNAKFYADDVMTLEQFEANKTALILDAETARQEQLKAIRQPADDYLDVLSMQGMSAIDLIDQQERLKLEKLREFANQGLVDYSDFEDAKTAIFMQSAKEREELQLAQDRLMLSSGEQFFGAMADLQKTFGNEQSDAYKVLFAVSKGFAIAQAALNLSSAIASAAVTGITPAEKFANMAAVAAAVGQVASGIASITYSPREQGGQFSSGQQLLVGERGPELVKFGSGGRIANTNDTMKGGAANITIVNQTSGKIDKVDQQQSDDGHIILIVQEVLEGETRNPNSRFNKAMNQTRNAPRKF